MSQTTTSTNSFQVSDVEVSTKMLPELSFHAALMKFVQTPVEACSNSGGNLVGNVRSHPLIAAMHGAFCGHYPLVLSPDIIWLTITQGVASHINENAEELRHQFVAHEGQVDLVVRRDQFVKGSPHNQWPGVFTEFSEKIRDHIGSTCDLFVADFSTTGPVERAASEIVLLDAMQSYFTYEVRTLCGIPSIKLEGTVEDWQSIVFRAEKLCQHGLQWWFEDLQPILNQFVEAASGKIDRKFWDSIYKYNGSDGSGTPYVSGWVNCLFPYLWERTPMGAPRKLLPNPWIKNEPTELNGPTREVFPNTTAIAPFRWVIGMDEENLTAYDMEFIGGLVGVAQDPENLALRPEIGWAVRDAAAQSSPYGFDPENYLEEI